MRPMAATGLHLHVHIPDYFCCPISLDLMRDPVILSTGQTYDRSSIEKWLAEGNLTCPVTRQPLKDRSLIPNSMLLRLIQDWCVANRSLGVERIPTPRQPVSPEQVAFLVEDIKSDCSKPQKAHALKRLRSLAKESQRNKLLMVEMDVVPVLLSAMFSSEGENLRSTEIAEEVLSVLVSFPFCGKSRDELAEPHKLRFLSYLLQHGSLESRTNAGRLVQSLTSSEGASDRWRCLVGSTEGLMDGLVGLIKEKNDAMAVKAGIKALFGSCLARSNLKKAVAAGAAAALVECLFLGLGKSDVERAVATIELLCKTAEGTDEIRNHALSLVVLQKVLLKISNQASESAAAILFSICISSERLQEAALEEGMFTHLLLLLQSECTSRAKKKARCLLKLLSDNWPDHPCVRAPGRTDVLAF